MKFEILAYNGISKIVTNHILINIHNSNDILMIQWFRYQILKMCENLNIDTQDPITKGIYNNTTLAHKIMEHPHYNKMIIKSDDMQYGLSPCIHSTYISPITKNTVIKHMNGVELVNTNIIWECEPILENK